MAGSGTGTESAAASSANDFSVNSTDIIKAALRITGDYEAGEPIDSNIQADALQALNMIIKQLMGPPTFLMRGLKPWQRERTSLTLTAKAKFELKSSGGDLDITPPVHILSAKLMDSDDNETTLTQLNIDQYDAIANKTDENTPQAFYYERRLDTGYFYLNCVPSDITEYTIEISYLDQLGAFVTVSTTTDFPQEYFRVLKFALAVDYGAESDFDISQIIGLRDEAMLIAGSFHPEQTKEYYQPGID